jgi:hypothetical protein
MRKHSSIPLPRCAARKSTSIDLQASWRLASIEGGASAVFGATCAQTAWITASKIGTATWPPVAPPPSVRRLHRRFRPQMGAAVNVVATGGLLWYLVNPGSFGTTEQILAVGVFCAFVAAGVQGISGGSALRKLSIAGESEASRLRHRVATGQRVAAAF